MSERESDLGAFLAGFFIGGLVGVAVALLFAPQSGEETRVLIRDKSIELKDKAATTYDEYYARAGEFADTTRQKAVELQQRGQQALEQQKTRLSGGKSPEAMEPPAEEAPAEG